MDRDSIVFEPSRVVFDGASFYSKSPIQVDLGTETFDVKTDAHGTLDKRVDEFTCNAKFTPDGRFTAEIIAALWPHLSANMGTRLFTSTDKPCRFHKLSGGLATMITAAVRKMPQLTFSSVETLVGEVELVGLRGNNLDPSAANSLFTVAGGGGTFADAGFTGPGQIKTQPYRAAWGAIAGFTDFETEKGFTFDSEVSVSAVKLDSTGTLNLAVTEVTAMVKCRPVGPSAANILAALKVQGAGVVRGQSAGLSAALTITGADTVVYMTIPNAGLKTGGFKYGALELEANEIGFFAKRTFTAGALQPIATLAAS